MRLGKALRNCVVSMYKVILLLIGSNVFMTVAWYGHLKMRWLDGRPLIAAIAVSWGIAFFEYCLQVPANRMGYLTEHFSGYQLKILQEVITLTVFWTRPFPGTTCGRACA